SSDIPYSPLTENARIGVGSNFNNFLMTCEDSWFDLESYKHFIPDEPNNYYIRSYYEGSDKTNLYQLYYTMKGNSDVTTPHIRTVSVKDTNLLKRASIDYENQVITLTAYNNKKNHFNYVSLSSLITYTTSEDVDVVVGRDDICNLLSPRKYRVMGTDQTYTLCTVQVVPDGGEWAEVQEEVENDYVMTIDDGERFCAYSDFETGWTEAIPLSKKRPTTVTLLSDWIAPDKDGDGNGDFYYENSSGSEYGTDEGRLHLATDTIEITIDLNGHTISRNLSSPKKHGQVFRIEAGSLTITDSSEAQTGKITGGNNNGDGGAFYITDGSIFVESGEISGNKCTENGAGIYSDEMICISGGKITGNTAGKAGGGVYANKSVYLGGTAVVTGNKQAQNVESNIYLPKNSVNINHTRGQATGIPNIPLTEGANIGITSVDTYDLISGDDSCFDQGSFGYLHADASHTYYIRSVYDASKGNNAHQLYYNAWSDANARYPHVKSVEVKNTNILKSAELDDIQQYITLKAYKHKKTAFDNISLGSLISCEYDKDTYYIYDMDVPHNLYSGYEYKIMSDNGTYLTCKIIIEWVECSHNDSDENCICDYCGEYTLTEFAITGYNAETKEATVFVPEAGKYTLIFADYEGNKLDSIDIVEHKFTEGINTVQQENKTFMLANGDKVMLWYDLINLVPVCDALTIK
ncbi:MAG: hypothetical protein II306_06955, partial [Clostridia bacterium]|nr:hypothetical protein [Clostridia bacterium]